MQHRYQKGELMIASIKMLQDTTSLDIVTQASVLADWIYGIVEKELATKEPHDANWSLEPEERKF